MANEIFDWPTARGLPIPYITAVWSGMDQVELVAGLRAGTILAPPGSPKGWLPPDRVGASQQVTTEASTSASAEAAAVAVDRAKVKGWFDALDAKLDSGTFDAIWNGAGANDAARTATLTDFLAGTLLGKSAAASDARDGQQGRAPSATVAALDAFVADPAHQAKIVDLSTKTGAELAALAQTDLGYRQALVALQPLALVGNRALFAAQNANGQLDRFDPDSGESLLSDAWLGDRGKFLAWKNAENAGKELTIDGAQGWTFVDRGARDAAGNSMTLELKARAADATSNQVVFGNNESEVIKGQGGTDRIYGGGGDDVLRGGGGADRLEGGAGDDLAFGGAGNDELLGNQGADELDGGAGADQIAGGSGDDVLTGGRGDDRLEGGAGNDTYIVDAGDGTDTIIDADGVGSIVLDDRRIEGTMQRAQDQWRSADGRLEFGFAGDATEGGTLTIQSFDAGADRSGTAANVVQVKNWKNGDLGITLDGELGAASAASGPEPGASADAAGEGALIDAASSVPVLATSSTDSATNGGSTGDTSAMAPASDPVGGADPSGGDAASDGAGGGEPASDAGSGNGAVSSFDFESALNALFGSNAAALNAASLNALNPGQVQEAIAAFSGVPAPPDVGPGFVVGTGDVAAAVTTSHVADALASDVSSDDLEAETGAAMMPISPALRQTDAISPQLDRAANSLGSGVMGQSR